VVNFSLVDDPTIQQPVSTFHDNIGLCLTVYGLRKVTGICRKLWNQAATDLCPCGEKQTMSHIVNSYPLTKLNGGLSQLHSADDEAIVG